MFGSTGSTTGFVPTIKIRTDDPDDGLRVPVADFGGHFVSASRFALFLGVPESRLARWRCNKKGPHAAKICGRVYYDQSVIAKFIMDHRLKAGEGLSEAA